LIHAVFPELADVVVHLVNALLRRVRIEEERPPRDLEIHIYVRKAVRGYVSGGGNATAECSAQCVCGARGSARIPGKDLRAISSLFFPM